MFYLKNVNRNVNLIIVKLPKFLHEELFSRRTKKEQILCIGILKKNLKR